MAEKKFEIVTIGIDFVCDHCGVGTMEQTGPMLCSDPPQWVHKCTNPCCGKEERFFVKYPTVRYERRPT